MELKYSFFTELDNSLLNKGLAKDELTFDDLYSSIKEKIFKFYPYNKEYLEDFKIYKYSQENTSLYIIGNDIKDQAEEIIGGDTFFFVDVNPTDKSWKRDLYLLEFIIKELSHRKSYNDKTIFFTPLYRLDFSNIQFDPEIIREFADKLKFRFKPSTIAEPSENKTGYIEYFIENKPFLSIEVNQHNLSKEPFKWNDIEIIGKSLEWVSLVKVNTDKYGRLNYFIDDEGRSHLMHRISSILNRNYQQYEINSSDENKNIKLLFDFTTTTLNPKEKYAPLTEYSSNFTDDDFGKIIKSVFNFNIEGVGFLDDYAQNYKHNTLIYFQKNGLDFNSLPKSIEIDFKDFAFTSLKGFADDKFIPIKIKDKFDIENFKNFIDKYYEIITNNDVFRYELENNDKHFLMLFGNISLNRITIENKNEYEKFISDLSGYLMTNKKFMKLAQYLDNEIWFEFEHGKTKYNVSSLNVVNVPESPYLFYNINLWNVENLIKQNIYEGDILEDKDPFYNIFINNQDYFFKNENFKFFLEIKDKDNDTIASIVNGILTDASQKEAINFLYKKMGIKAGIDIC